MQCMPTLFADSVCERVLARMCVWICARLRGAFTNISIDASHVTLSRSRKASFRSLCRKQFRPRQVVLAVSQVKPLVPQRAEWARATRAPNGERIWGWNKMRELRDSEKIESCATGARKHINLVDRATSRLAAVRS